MAIRQSGITHLLKYAHVWVDLECTLSALVDSNRTHAIQICPDRKNTTIRHIQFYCVVLYFKGEKKYSGISSTLFNGSSEMS